MEKVLRWLLVMVVVVAAGCGKEETKVSAENSVVEGARSVVRASGDALRSAAKGVNDAVYGSRK